MLSIKGSDRLQWQTSKSIRIFDCTKGADSRFYAPIHCDPINRNILMEIINMDEIVYPNQDYKVIVRCFTYNQSRYITDALNGFACQKTYFPYACVILDDASSDGEQNIIKSWLDSNCDLNNAKIYDIETANVIVASVKANLNCTMAVYLLKENLWRQSEKKMALVKPWRNRCQYEALCEGDDYWTGDKKLQCQVDFMDNNKDFAMCFHGAKIELENDNLFSSLSGKVENREYSAEELYEKWIVPTASMLYRREVMERTYIGKERMLNGDIVRVLDSACIGKIMGMTEKMSVYRIQQGGVTYNRELIKKRIMRLPQHEEFINDNYAEILDKKLRCRALAAAYRQRFYCQKVFTKHWFSDLYKSLKYEPFVLFKKLYEKLHSKNQ